MSKRRILIVDDDAHIRKLLSLYLRDENVEIHEASGGEEAIALFGQYDFDVILLDLILPYFGGFRLCQKFKTATDRKKPYIIIITGDDSPETRSTAKECGADQFLAKPFSGNEVHALIEQVLEGA